MAKEVPCEEKVQYLLTGFTDASFFSELRQITLYEWLG